ncbi:aspartate carbamoyltransferase catalytic subunit [Brachybacterium sp. JHP9]|uniref:Aspartate carbamoyltransferase n=1 Tax=Brachybacterium equifaecis TaxID=2910770 RepID=A0ABT0R0I2_9MICO|nr:aspartate carbamoyltransferase catalytic subunit [Brachybacterium equifaecis]MCL6423421.1 aspartate carbamoyltransferase catalytic subunit [Brachybacterium equifaecis]
MKHLITIADLDRAAAIELLDTSERMAATQERQMRKLPALLGSTIVNLFMEDSTRTKLSFEAAAKRLSADVIGFAAKGSSISKGESLKDTALTLRAMGADAVVVRAPSSGAAHKLAHAGWIDVPIINAGDGTHQHPTQALLDAFTLRRHLGARSASGSLDGAGLDGLHVVIVGDILHSRVARSNVQLMTMLGARVTVVAPPSLVPVGADVWPCEVSYDFDDAIAQGPDAVMMLRVQRERMLGGGYFPSAAEYTRLLQLTDARAARLPEHAIIMHPGPMNRGFEIAGGAADGPRSVIIEQVAAGVVVRMAVLFHLLASNEREGS